MPNVVGAMFPHVCSKARKRLNKFDSILGFHVSGSLGEEVFENLKLSKVMQFCVSSPAKAEDPNVDKLKRSAALISEYGLLPVIHSPYTVNLVRREHKSTPYTLRYAVKLFYVLERVTYQKVPFVLHTGKNTEDRELDLKELRSNCLSMLQTMDETYKLSNYLVCIETDPCSKAGSKSCNIHGLVEVVSSINHPGLRICYDCLGPKSKIETDEGPIQIDSLYRRFKKNVPLPLALTEENGERCYRSISFVDRRSLKVNEKVHRVRTSLGVLYCSSEHVFFGESEVKAKELIVGQKIFCSKSSYSSFQREVLLGTLLGDTCLQKIPSGKVRIQFQQGFAQKDYFGVKLQIFRNHIQQESPCETFSPRNNGEMTMVFKSCSEVSEELLEIYDLCYRDGQRYFSKEWLNQLTEVGLAFWCFDDGSYQERSQVFFLHVQSRSPKEIENIQEALKILFDLNTKVSWTKKGPVLMFLVESTKRLLEILCRNCYSSDMFYKCEGLIVGSLPEEENKITSVVVLENNIVESKWGYLYDMTVEGTHRYFAQHLLVHNTEHTYASGIDINIPMPEHYWDWIGVVHLNSIPPEVKMGSCLDRHSHTTLQDCSIDKTYIQDVFDHCIKRNIPTILEREHAETSSKDIAFLNGLFAG